MRENITVGKAAEFRVASELLLRGYETYMATADSGVDLILGNGKRIQVKSAHKTRMSGDHDAWRCKSYKFSFKSWRPKDGHFIANSLDSIDFVILWAIDDSIFFIIPAEKIRGKYTVRFNPDSTKQQSEFVAYRGKWELLNSEQNGGDA